MSVFIDYTLVLMFNKVSPEQLEEVTKILAHAGDVVENRFKAHRVVPDEVFIDDTSKNGTNSEEGAT